MVITTSYTQSTTSALIQLANYVAWPRPQCITANVTPHQQLTLYKQLAFVVIVPAKHCVPLNKLRRELILLYHIRCKDVLQLRGLIICVAVRGSYGSHARHLGGYKMQLGVGIIVRIVIKVLLYLAAREFLIIIWKYTMRVYFIHKSWNLVNGFNRSIFSKGIRDCCRL